MVPYHDYTTAKSALVGFSRNLASELGPLGIRVNCVAPGLVYPTEGSAGTRAQFRESLMAATPLRRLARPEDVAGPVLFLASDWSGFVTGQVLLVDGGTGDAMNAAPGLHAGRGARARGFVRRSARPGRGVARGRRGRGLHPGGARRLADWLDTPHARRLAARLCAHPAGLSRSVWRDALTARLRGGRCAAARPHALAACAAACCPGASSRREAQRTLAAPRRLDLYAIVDSAAPPARRCWTPACAPCSCASRHRPLPDAAWHALLRDEVAAAVADRARRGRRAVRQRPLAARARARRIRRAPGPGGPAGPGRAAAAPSCCASGMALGISSHSLWELSRARALSPRYIACGPVWPTLTKDMPWVPQGLDNLAWWCRAAGAPVTAIGGILGPGEVEAAARTRRRRRVHRARPGRGPAPEPARCSKRRCKPAAATSWRKPPEWPHPSLPPSPPPRERRAAAPFPAAPRLPGGDRCCWPGRCFRSGR